MPAPDASITFRVTYANYASLRADVAQQFDRSAFLVRVPTTPDATPGAPVRLEVVLPDGTTLGSDGEVLNVFEGHGVAITTRADLGAELRKRIAWNLEPEADTSPPQFSRIESVAPPPTDAAPARTGEIVATTEGRSHAEKIHMALHGTRDERNAVLRDKNRGLHPFVLKNPQITAEDVAQIARNPQSSVELLKFIAEKKEWLQRSSIALALTRNPRTPPEIGVRALEHVGPQALREIAKGMGALPHIVQAARKKVIGK